MKLLEREKIRQTKYNSIHARKKSKILTKVHYLLKCTVDFSTPKKAEKRKNFLTIIPCAPQFSAHNL